MGGTHSLNLSLQACHPWQWFLQRNILLSAEHLPGTLNTVADGESRHVETSAEWMLHKEVFQRVQDILGTCRVDLFATRLNHQLPEFVSRKLDPLAQGTDALQVDWKTLKGYALPPSA